MGSKTIGEVIADGGLKRFMDPCLIKALGHPVREHILAVLNERVASPKEIGLELELEVQDFYHHFEVLEELGCIERVETKQRRGAVEHFFRATTCLLIDDGRWTQVPATIRSDLSASFLQAIFDEASNAMRQGTFGTSDDSHIAWIPGDLDEQGLREQIAILNATLACSKAIHEGSARRLAKTGDNGTRWMTAVLGFEAPEPPDDGGELTMNRQVPAPA